MKTILLPAAFALAAAILATGCSPAAKSAGGGVPVLAAQAVESNVPVQIQPPPVGHVLPYSTVTIHSQIQGMISQIHFQEGQAVTNGQPLFSIDPRPAQAALDQARANLKRDSGQLEYQKANHARDQKLLASKIISQDQFDTDTANLDTATGTVAADKAAIANALLNLAYCKIDAPVDGIAGALQSYVGSVVKAPDDALVTVNQIHPIYVQFAVPERYLPEIRRQMSGHQLKVGASYENMTGSPPEGELTFVDNTVNTMTGTIELRATFRNKRDLLWPGQFVAVDLTLSELTNAVVVPSQAVQTGQNGQFIYVLKSSPTNQIAEMRPVTIGIDYDGQTVVEKGLKAGETVVTDGQLRLAPGMAVKLPGPAAPATNSPAKAE